MRRLGLGDAIDSHNQRPADRQIDGALVGDDAVGVELAQLKRRSRTVAGSCELIGGLKVLPPLEPKRQFWPTARQIESIDVGKIIVVADAIGDIDFQPTGIPFSNALLAPRS